MNAKQKLCLFFVLITAAVVGLGCSPSSSSSDGDVSIGEGEADEGFTHADADVDTGDNGDSHTDTDLDADTDVETDAKPDADLDSEADTDGTCHSTESAIAAKPVRVMILLDESSSMSHTIPWLPSTTFWQGVAAGLQHIFEGPVTRYFSFGLDAFPDGTLEYFEHCYMPCCPETCPYNPECIALLVSCDRGCSVDLPPIVSMDRVATSGPQIIEYMSVPYLPCTFASTPLLRQMEYYLVDRSTEMPGFYSGDGGSYLLVISDGEDTCDAEGDPPDPTDVIASLGSITAELLTTYNIRTFAVGFSDGTGTAADELNAIASNGGTAFMEFFAIDDAGKFEAALDTIASNIASCIFDVQDPAATADPDAVNFYFDGEVVVFDDTCTNGWRWTGDTHMQVEFCGPSCDMIYDGSVEDIEAQFGCPTIML